MASEAVAEPVAGLGLYAPVLPASSVGQVPAVELSGEVQRPARGKPDLNTAVDVEQRVGKDIALDGYVLGTDATEGSCDGCHQI